MLWWIIGIVVLVLLVLLGLWVISVYNRLVSNREFVRNSMGNIATQVESRWDAVRGLIDAAKHYAAHESETLAEIAANRSNVDRTSDPSTVEKDDALFGQAMNHINVIAEAYPELKADGLYIQAMDGLERYENNVRQARMVYNDTVTKLNRQIQQFPSSIVANMFGFSQEEYFQNTSTKADMPQW